MRLRLLGLGLLPLLLAGCAAGTPEPARTVTVSVTPTASAPPAGEAAAWDLHAVCAVEADIETLMTWRDQQERAHRLTGAESAAVLQAIAVQNLAFQVARPPAAVARDTDVLTAASGTLEHPTIDLTDPRVTRAQNDLRDTCDANGLTLGVLAQGG